MKHWRNLRLMGGNTRLTWGSWGKPWNGSSCSSCCGSTSTGDSDWAAMIDETTGSRSAPVHVFLDTGGWWISPPSLGEGAGAVLLRFFSLESSNCLCFFFSFLLCVNWIGKRKITLSVNAAYYQHIIWLSASRISTKVFIKLEWEGGAKQVGGESPLHPK